MGCAGMGLASSWCRDGFGFFLDGETQVIKIEMKMLRQGNEVDSG